MADQPDATLVASRRFGDATVTLISEGTFPWRLELQVPESAWRRAMPEADASGAIILGINVAHIRLGDASILVDPGFDDPAAPSPPQFPGLVRSAGLVAGLRSIDVEPDTITHVLITHTHDDHYAGVTTEGNGRRAARFPHARHLVGRRDWEGNPDRERSESALAIHLGTLDRFGLLTRVDDEHEVVPGVTMVAAPGESPGHSIVRVEAGAAPCYILGDLFHHACEVAHLDWVSPGRDLHAMHASRERLITEAIASCATVVFTHAQFPGWGRIVPDGTGYRWERG